ncbi:MAG TPA: alanine--tRNA ligase [Thermoleophilaceae bacterium]|nr:alanine--tRNA ligase [Thermoleophilaceae bacterium]
MKAAEIRESYLSFFEARDHRRMPSASLVPPTHDPSVLLTTAGMQPFKPYFRGDERPPHPRLASCQKCFRTPDIENVGSTARHLTFFEMLGNFSIGDYFKERAVECALELSTQGFGFRAEDIWITVFGGDEALGLGPDEEAIDCWRGVGVPDDRIVRLGRADNFWQAGPTGPCGPCSELYLDRGPGYGPDSDRPGDDTDRLIEYWNLVFMQYELLGDGRLEPLPARNIDTGAGLDRVAMLAQGVDSVFDTDYLRSLVAVGEELSGRAYGADFETTRALRILADHGRGMTFLLADGVVPSNEERGYVLRRIMRRAILQGRVLGIEETFLPRLAERTIEIAGSPYSELGREADTIAMWARSEEEAFLRTLEQGERLLAEVVRHAREQGTSWVSAADAFRLHDTYGFPYELTKELLSDAGLAVDDQGFAELMDEARERARAGRPTEVSGRAVARAGGGSSDALSHERVLDFARAAGFPTRFLGYETTEVDTVLGALEPAGGRLLAKLEESPFYPEGGGQVSDDGFVELPSGARSRVTAVFRLGDDQALELEAVDGDAPRPQAGDPVLAVVDRSARLATMANHTATHLLHAALRERLGTHVRQAGSYVGPDKLRFDFTHGERLSDEELAEVEERVTSWVSGGHPVRAVHTTRDEAERLGAMALFGEKYGDWVRMVEVEGVSRELCGGTHVASTAEVGLFHVTGETSSASNVRRIEAVTGPGGIEAFRARTEALRQIAALLRVPERDALAAVQRLTERVRELERRPRESGRELAEQLVAGAVELGGVRVVTEPVEVPDPKALLELSDRVKQTLGESAVVLGCALDGRVHLVANVAPGAVARGVRAGEVVRAAAQAAGGGGGGRDTMAQAGGRDPEKLPEAIAAARLAIEQSLA